MTLPWPINVTVQTLQQIVASVAAGWHVEHLGDGTHDWHWTTPAFDAQRFRGDGTVTWTVASADREFENYAILGDVMIWNLGVGATDTGGSASANLQITIPGGYRSVGTVRFPAGYLEDAGTVRRGVVKGNIDQHYVQISHDAGTWSAAAAGNTSVYFSVIFRVMR